MARYQEQDAIPNARPDFVQRKRHGTIKIIALLYIVAFIIALYTTFSGDAAQSTQHNILLLVSFAALSGFAVFSLQKNLDLITEVEFQNALFSSAIGRGYKFTLIAKHDGSFAFADRGLRDTFPGVSTRNSRELDALVEAAGLARSDIERLHEAIRQQESVSFLFPITSASGDTTTMFLSLRPLERPKGFFLIQGREYVSRQEEISLKNSVERVPADPYIGYLLKTLPIGVYVASPSGMLRVTSGALENALGYAPGALVREEKAVADLLYQADGENPGTFDTQDFEGRILLRKQNGSLLKAEVLQKIVRDEDGNMLCVLGLVEAETEQF